MLVGGALGDGRHPPAPHEAGELAGRTRADGSRGLGVLEDADDRLGVADVDGEQHGLLVYPIRRRRPIPGSTSRPGRRGVSGLEVEPDVEDRR